MGGEGLIVTVDHGRPQSHSLHKELRVNSMNSWYKVRKPNGQHLEMTLPPFSALPRLNGLLCHDLSVLFGQFHVFLKANGMPISEKEISTTPVAVWE